MEALLAGGGLAISSATQLTVGDGTLANALPTQDAPRRGILVAPPGELLGDEGDVELTACAERPATNLPLPAIDEGGAPDTQVSRASAQATVHAGEALEGGLGDGDSPVLGMLVGAEATQPEGAAASATTALGTAVASSSDGELASGARATSSDGGLALGGSEGGLAHSGDHPGAPGPAPTAPPP